MSFTYLVSRGKIADREGVAFNIDPIAANAELTQRGVGEGPSISTRPILRAWLNIFNLAYAVVLRVLY